MMRKTEYNVQNYIDCTEKWTERLCSNFATDVLTETEKEIWNSIPGDKKKTYVKELIEKPIVFENPEIIYDWYFRNKWADALKAVHNKESISVFEIGAGGCNIVPKAVLYGYNHSDTKYMTANLNKELTQIFKWKTENDPIVISVVEDDAANIKKYIGDDRFDVIAFEHSLNDVLETILAEKNGIDTVNKGWMEILPAITEVVNREWTNGTFEKNVKIELLNLINTCLEVLKPDGWLIFAHYQFQYNLDIGLSAELNSSLIPMVRNWLEGIGVEVIFEGFDDNWWMFIKNTK